MGDKYTEFYQTNEDFKKYVDSYCRTRKVSLATALAHKVVHLYYDYLKEKESGREEGKTV